HAIGRPVVGEFDKPRAFLPVAIKAMRPYQWVKNLLVFVPILASRSFSDLSALTAATSMFGSFCVTASAIYLINDLFDVEADRAHPRKRLRPFASGDLSPRIGAALAVLLMLFGFALAFTVGAAAPLAIYALISISYSVVLKKYPLIDVFV